MDGYRTCQRAFPKEMPGIQASRDTTGRPWTPRSGGGGAWHGADDSCDGRPGVGRRQEPPRIWQGACRNLEAKPVEASRLRPRDRKPLLGQLRSRRARLASRSCPAFATSSSGRSPTSPSISRRSRRAASRSRATITERCFAASMKGYKGRRAGQGSHGRDRALRRSASEQHPDSARSLLARGPVPQRPAGAGASQVQEAGEVRRARPSSDQRRLTQPQRNQPRRRFDTGHRADPPRPRQGGADESRRARRQEADLGNGDLVGLQAPRPGRSAGAKARAVSV